MSNAGRLTTILPEDAIPVSAYADLDRYLSAFAGGTLQLVMLLGRHGTGKTQRVKAAVGLTGAGDNKDATYPRVLYLGGTSARLAFISSFGNTATAPS